jgi:hypothetical protein
LAAAMWKQRSELTTAAEMKLAEAEVLATALCDEHEALATALRDEHEAVFDAAAPAAVGATAEAAAAVAESKRAHC